MLMLTLMFLAELRLYKVAWDGFRETVVGNLLYVRQWFSVLLDVWVGSMVHLQSFPMSIYISS